MADPQEPEPGLRPDLLHDAPRCFGGDFGLLLLLDPLSLYRFPFTVWPP